MKKIIYVALRVVFALYCAFVIYFFFLNQRHSYNMELWEYIKSSINLIPFKTISMYISKINSGLINTSTIVTNLVGNLIIFLPMGFFLPAIFKSVNSILKCLLTGIILISVIEISQLIFKIGVFDIDDYILNIIGLLCGYGIFSIKCIKKFVYCLK